LLIYAIKAGAVIIDVYHAFLEEINGSYVDEDQMARLRRTKYRPILILMICKETYLVLVTILTIRRLTQNLCEKIGKTLDSGILKLMVSDGI
jgi:hypothetical protein